MLGTFEEADSYLTFPPDDGYASDPSHFAAPLASSWVPLAPPPITIPSTPRAPPAGFKLHRSLSSIHPSGSFITTIDPLMISSPRRLPSLDSPIALWPSSRDLMVPFQIPDISPPQPSHPVNDVRPDNEVESPASSPESATSLDSDDEDTLPQTPHHPTVKQGEEPCIKSKPSMDQRETYPAQLSSPFSDTIAASRPPRACKRSASSLSATSDLSSDCESAYNPMESASTERKGKKSRCKSPKTKTRNSEKVSSPSANKKPNGREVASKGITTRSPGDRDFEARREQNCRAQKNYRRRVKGYATLQEDFSLDLILILEEEIEPLTKLENIQSLVDDLLETAHEVHTSKHREYLIRLDKARAEGAH